ncbi:MAG: 30S ribosomal protein S16 [Pirellulaceae bacterium]
MDARTGRDGRVIEELGYYDPMVKDTDARAVLVGDRIAYWLSVGAQPTEKVAVLIKKYGAEGTHLEAQKAALEKISTKRQASAVVVANAKKARKAADAPAEPAPAEAAAGAEG